MGKQDKEISRGLSRRGLLRTAGLGAGAAGLAAAEVSAGTALAGVAAGTKDATSGYRETDHVKAYYQALARY